MINLNQKELLQFPAIINEVKKRAIGEYTKEKISNFRFSSDLSQVSQWQEETKEARLILESQQHVPFMGLKEIKKYQEYVEKGLSLQPSELIDVADFLRSSRTIKQFFAKNQFQTPILAEYTQLLSDFSELEETIYQKIQNNQVATDASRLLRKTRKKMTDIEKEIQDKLNRFIRSDKNNSYLQEKMIIKKGDHYTVPIKVAYKNRLKGTIVETSNKGQTIFFEPESVTKLMAAYEMEKATETAEIYQILAELSGGISEKMPEIKETIEVITALDFIFARGKYSRELKGVTPLMNREEIIELNQARHPFLTGEVVPLDFSLGENYRGLVITGANAGGKTVVLKTVGLLVLMGMFGLQLPTKKPAKIPVLDHLLVDIGDQQDLANALSTFSGHLKNISHMLEKVSRHTLVLLDEIGSGTEPNEGASLAVAILEEMYEKGALVLATTHYGEIKEFAIEHEDFLPAAMAFDQENLQPKFQLLLGQVGNSQALWIAKKMNIQNNILQKAASYMKKAPYETKKKEFKTNQEKIAEKIQEFSVGDRVLLKETKEVGLIYEDLGKDEVLVFLNDELRTVLRKRVSLLMSASELYPADYEVNQLFVDYQTRKKERDLLRGSKKARKQLEKEAKERRL